MGKSRLGQVWAARQFARNRPWQRAREAKRLREAEAEAQAADQPDRLGGEATGSRGEATDFKSSESSEDSEKEESA
jgi:hypothetical protein